MKPCVDQSKCVNCGLCYSQASDVFTLDLQKAKAAVKQNVSYEESQEQINEAIASCPMDAISLCEK